MARKVLPPDKYYESLARVPTSGGAIFTNNKGELLLVKQTYREDWHIAGGIADKNENPREAAIREVREELGLKIDSARMFCADFVKGAPFDRFLFLFDCGVLDDATIAKIKIDNEEISEFGFFPKEQALKVLSPLLANRIKNSWDGFTKGHIVYLENGKRV